MSQFSQQSTITPDDDFILFTDEAEDLSGEMNPQMVEETTVDAWKILIVDDDPSVHRATQLALRGFTFADKSISFISAYSGQEGIELMTQHYSDVAILLLDVVMETNDAGLKVVKYIRDELCNHRVRIILRTGNPGEAPEESVILNYDINDYRLKVELTRQRLITSLVSALRSFRDITLIEQQKRELDTALHRLERAKIELQAYSYNLEIEVSKRTAALEQSNRELRRLAMLDGLTMVSNRRHFDACIQEQWMLLAQLQQPLSLILLDVDCFKLYNDHYGHLAGDDCLKQVARALEQVLKRPTDVVARYGGEEFAIILPLTSLAGAQRIARTISQTINDLNIPHAYSAVADHVTLSQGISSLIPSPQASLNTLVATADMALYQAKQWGRNQACVYGESQLPIL
jgi:diguanylate cyclase